MPDGAGEAANISGPARTESHTKSHRLSKRTSLCWANLRLPRNAACSGDGAQTPGGLSESDLGSRLEHPCEERSIAGAPPTPVLQEDRASAVGRDTGVHVQRRRQRRACARSYVGLGRRRAGQGGSGSHRGLEPSLTAGELEGPGPAGRPWPRPDVGCGVGSCGPGSDRRGSRCRAVRAPSRPPHSCP